MKISIVTISFNQAKFLKQCIDSVLSQDYSNIEYIIVDPGSADGSREIIESYGDRIIKVFEKDNGPADGLNKGFSCATGDIFYFINSDDYLLPNAIAKIMCYFKLNPEIDVVLSGGIRVNENGKFERSFYPSKVSAKLYVNGAVTLFQQGMFFKSEIFRNIGGFNVENKVCWDGELLLAFLLKEARFLRLMTKVAAFRIYPESITGSQRYLVQGELDRVRMFNIVYGNSTKQKFLGRYFYRIKKFVNDPVYLFVRLFW